jgi:hypothetical protein
MNRTKLIIGVISCIVIGCLLAVYYLPVMWEPDVTDEDDCVWEQSVEWDSVVIESSYNIMQCGYNNILWIVENGNTTGNITFAIARTDTRIGTSYTTAQITGTGTFTNRTSNITYDLVKRCECGLHLANWYDCDGNIFNERIVLPDANHDRTAITTLSITLNPSAVSQMGDYEGALISLKVACEYWYIYVLVIP